MTKTWTTLQSTQPIAVRMLQNSIQKNRISHAYLFEGPKGVGKKETGMQLAKSIFCLQREGIQPCLHCVNCRRIESGNHPDVFFIEPEGQSIKKYQIQILQDEFTKTGVESRKKLYMIEHADRMTVNAANSLLKFLEEPNDETVAVLLTEQAHQLLPTIISRCQMITFRPLQMNILRTQLLEEGIAEPLVQMVIQLTNDKQEAISYCHDDWFAKSRVLVIKLYQAIRKKQGLLCIHEEWIKHFQDRQQLQIGLDMLLLLYKDILYTKVGKETSIVFCDQVSVLQETHTSYSTKRVTEILFSILEAKRKLNANMNSQLIHEQLVLHLQEG